MAKSLCGQETIYPSDVINLCVSPFTVVRRGTFKELEGGGLAQALILRADDIPEQLVPKTQLVEAGKMCTFGETAMGVVREWCQSETTSRDAVS